MARLPPHHVPRPRLTEPCRDARLVVVEAAGGFGKTVFAAELVDLWRAVGIEVQLDHDATPASLLAARLHAALRRAGYTEAASAAAEAGEDVIGGVDAALDALRGEQCAVVVDDAHFATPDAAALLCHVGERLTDGLRLVVLARALPKGAERLRRAEATCVGSADLALRPDETLAVCVQGFGLAVSTAGATALDDATGGWTAATALAAARARRTGEDPATVARAAKGEPDAAVRTILAEPLGVLGSAGRAALAQAARLPLLDADVVDAAADEAGFFSRALSAGIPFTPSRGAWFDLPGPVRDHLASLAPVAPEALRAVAAHYACRDELGEALQLLVAAGDTVGAAGVLAATEPRDPRVARRPRDARRRRRLRAGGVRRAPDRAPHRGAQLRGRRPPGPARGLLGAGAHDRRRGRRRGVPPGGRRRGGERRDARPPVQARRERGAARPGRRRPRRGAHLRACGVRGRPSAVLAHRRRRSARLLRPRRRVPPPRASRRALRRSGHALGGGGARAVLGDVGGVRRGARRGGACSPRRGPLAHRGPAAAPRAPPQLPRRGAHRARPLRRVRAQRRRPARGRGPAVQRPAPRLRPLVPRRGGLVPRGRRRHARRAAARRGQQGRLVGPGGPGLPRRGGVVPRPRRRGDARPRVPGARGRRPEGRRAPRALRRGVARGAPRRPRARPRARSRSPSSARWTRASTGA